MKNYFVTILIAAALIISAVVMSKKAQAQNNSPQRADKKVTMTGDPALANTEPTPKDAVFVTEIPAGYRDWKVVSVAHEAGDLNDIRAILGNDIAIKAYREGKSQFPEGAIVGRIAWSYVPSEENNKTFGKEQSFVAGSPTPFYCNSWKRTQRSTRRQAGGDTRRSIITANLPARHLCKAAIPATN